MDRFFAQICEALVSINLLLSGIKREALTLPGDQRRGWEKIVCPATHGCRVAGTFHPLSPGGKCFFIGKKTAARKVIFRALNRLTCWVWAWQCTSTPSTGPWLLALAYFVTSYLGQILRLNNQIQFNYSNQRFQSHFFWLSSYSSFFWSLPLPLPFFFKWLVSCQGLDG